MACSNVHPMHVCPHAYPADPCVLGAPDARGRAVHGVYDMLTAVVPRQERAMARLERRQSAELRADGTLEVTRRATPKESLRATAAAHAAAAHAPSPTARHSDHAVGAGRAAAAASGVGSPHGGHRRVHSCGGSPTGQAANGGGAVHRIVSSRWASSTSALPRDYRDDTTMGVGLVPHRIVSR